MKVLMFFSLPLRFHLKKIISAKTEFMKHALDFEGMQRALKCLPAHILCLAK